MPDIVDTPTSQALTAGMDRWLRLRWCLAPGQIIAVLLAGPLPPRPPAWLLAALLGVTFLPGLAARVWRRVENERALLATLILVDVALLTVALALCGGASNPFSVLYLAYVILGCVLLGPRHGWISTVVASGFYAALFLLLPAPSGHGAHMHGGGSELGRHLWSMYFAFVAVAILAVLFVASVIRTLRVREADLAEAKARAERNERLASVMVLAAGTAHEMGTPLATIAITAKEMERAAADWRDPQWREDAQLIRREVERCRRLLDDLRGQAGTVEGETPVASPIGEVVAKVAQTLSEAERRRVTLTPASAAVEVFLPRAAFVQVLGNLVRNALEASSPDAPVLIDASAGAATVVRVTDRGHGMDAGTVARAREPFFTTKPPGAGLGLGLFLADRFARDLGGTLLIDSKPGAGTEIRLELPS